MSLDLRTVHDLQQALFAVAGIFPPFTQIVLCLTALPAARSYLRAPGIVTCAAALSAPLLPAVLHHPPLPSSTLFVRTVLAGVGGLSLALPFVAAGETLTMLGRVVDNTRGAQQAEQLLPGLESRASHLEATALLCGAALLLNSPLRFVLYSSLVTGPEGVTSPEGCIAAFSAALHLTLQFALPVAAPIFLLDVGLAYLSRLTPRVSLAGEAANLRNTTALAFLALFLGSAAEAVVARSVPLKIITTATADGDRR